MRSKHVAGRDRSAFTLVELLVVIAIIGMLVGILLPAVSAARESARKSQCANNLKQIGLGMLSYNESQGQFPRGSAIPNRGSRIGLSWNVYILPYIEMQNLYDEIDPQPTGVSHNLVRMTKQLEIQLFVCPSAPSANTSDASRSLANVKFGRSSYSGVGGSGRTPDSIVDLEDSDCGDYYTDGILYPNSEIMTAHIKDGLSNTYLIGERHYRARDWTYGSNWEGSPEKQLCLNSTKNARWPVNGSREQYGYLRDDPDAPEDAKFILANDLVFESYHPGGVSFVFADGHVAFETNDMDLECFLDRATIADGGFNCSK